MRLSGTYKAVVQEDFISTIARLNELRVSVKIEPFHNNSNQKSDIYFPYTGYLPPIKKDDIVYVVPINGETNTFMLFEWLGSYEKPSSLLLEGGHILATLDRFLMSLLEESYKLEVTKSSYKSNSNTFNIDSSSSLTEISVSGMINLKNTSTDMGSVISGLIESLIGMQTVGSPVAQKPDPATLIKFTEALVKWKLLVGG